MKAWEICKKENINKIYIDDKKKIKWQVKEEYKDVYDLYDSENDSINYYGYGISELAEMNFEEIINDIDWSKVPVDTKILVSDNREDWFKKYFAKYEKGKIYTIYTWANGRTSFTAKYDNDVISWKYARLYKEGEE